MSAPEDDAQRERMLGRGCALMLASGGLAAVGSVGPRRGLLSGVTLAIPLPLAVAATAVVLSLGVALVHLRPWEREREDEGS